MNRLTDGDVVQLRAGDNPLLGEWLDTNGRVGLRVTDKYGRGILFERDCMARLADLLSVNLPDMVGSH